jgi:hypothetical protein
LGNAYFKQGQLGRALYYYRKAEHLEARDPDIQANLRFTRERIAGEISVIPPVWVRVVRYFTLDEAAMACALLFWMWAALICLIRLHPEWQPKVRGVGFLLGSCVGLAVIVVAISYLASRERIAIVTVRQASVHLGPLTESQTSFTAADGSELEVLARRDEWMQVKDRSNRSGWVASTNVLVF